MLTIHRSERADRLVHALADVLAVPLDDPFTPEVVAVPSRGVERWISQSLATTLGTGPGRADGVCANVRFPSPSFLVAEAVARACGVDPDDDPWAARRLPWSLLEVVDACATEDWCRTLGFHIGAVGNGDRVHRSGRRVAVAQKLAGLFTAYSAQRPALVRAWLAGDDGDLDDDLRWQPELFRRLRAHLGTPGPAERLDEAVARLGGSVEALDLPSRLSLFGPTRLTVDQLMVVDAIAKHRDVHLWLPHPSPGLWERLAAAPGAVVPRRDDRTVDLPAHPLVSSLARDTRELQVMLTATTSGAAVVHHPASVETTTLLTRLQRDVHEDRVPSAEAVLDERDRSVRVHSCHGRLRQVEVLREVVLGLLADDPTLELRDIVVMCPDIESFAPLISATFGLADDEETDGHPAHWLKVRLADRSLRQTNPVLSVLSRVLDLADSRVTVSEVLDLAALPPVVRRFGFKDDELEQVGDWLRRAGVRWGLNAPARAPYHLEGVPQNTWESGLDRLLVGVAMDEDDLRTFHGVLPLDDVDSGDIDLAGRVAELVARIGAAVDDLTGRKPLTEWVDSLERALEDLTEVSPHDGWQVSQARSALNSAVQSAGARGSTVELGLADVRSLLASLLQGRPTRANFRTGHLTMCSMVPMRSVPHRVVILLGLDDQAFPRQAHHDGDNVLARLPLVGERDARTEDRQLFLDAILAAEEHLVILYSGHDERTGAVRPPAVPLGELLDVLDRTASVPDSMPGGRVRDQVLVQHPLQPFDPRNFSADKPFSFDPAAVAGARALVSERGERDAFLARPLPAETLTTVALDDLAAFVEHPVKAFLRQTLGLTFTSDSLEGDDALAVDLGGLAGWQIGDRLLRAGLSGEDLAVAARAELARGDLPPGPLGEAAIAPIREGAAALVGKSAALRSGDPDNVDVDITLPSGIRVLGTVANVYDNAVVRIEYSRLKPKHQLVGWLHALALVAHDPAVPWRSMVAGRSEGGIAYSHVSGVPADDAVAELDLIVDLYLRGLREPLPLTEQASALYAERRAMGAPVQDAQDKAAATWADRFGERADAAHRCVWAECDLTVLLAQPADPDEARADCLEPTRFGTLARRLWQPLIETAARGES